MLSYIEKAHNSKDQEFTELIKKSHDQLRQKFLSKLAYEKLWTA